MDVDVHDFEDLIGQMREHVIAKTEQVTLFQTNIEVLMRGAAEREAELLAIIRDREVRINELSKELTRAVHGADAIPEVEP